MSVKISGLTETKEWLKNLDEEMSKKLIKKVTQDAFENVKKLGSQHTDTGNMESNIRHKVKNNEGYVYIDDIGMLVDWKGKKVNYAAFVLFGSRPHTITPKHKKVLRSNSINDFVFDKKIHHPGYKGDDFLYKGVKQTLNKIDEIYKGIKL